MDRHEPKSESLQHRWTQLSTDRDRVNHRNEEYSRWTLPYLFPSTGTDSMELNLSSDSIGAQAVNNLANKVVSVLFPPQRMFFRLSIDERIRKTIENTLAQGGANIEQAKQQVAAALVQLERQLVSTEKEAQDYMDMVSYRPKAVEAAKLLIVTGNAMMYHPPGRPVQVFSMRDYCVVRDLSDQVIEIMTLEVKAFETFDNETQEALKQSRPKRSKNDKSQIKLYTRVVLEDDGKYHVYQQAEEVSLDTDGVVFTKEKLPWVPLVWNLVRGQDYGRGLVEEYSGAFHAINTIGGSLMNIAAIAGDIKFLVNPASLIDIPAMNSAPAGSYHAGRPDDVAAVNTNLSANFTYLVELLSRYERQISAAFLLNSNMTRNAERVTAEEIRMQANELELSNGGIYSRLASIWQQPTAYIVLDQINFRGLGEGVVPKIVTGMDSLSRVNEMENIHLWIMDLAMLDQIPDDVRARIRVSDYAKNAADNRQVDGDKFVKSEDEFQQEVAEQRAAMMAEQQMQTNQQAQVAAAGQAMKEG